MPDSNVYNEKELLLKIAEGDEQAFTIIFEQLLPRLQPAVMKWVRSEDAMKDVIQESFIRVWMNRDRLPGLDKPVNWIFRVAANECFTWLNKQALRSKKTNILRDKLESEFERETGADVLQAKETQQLITNAIDRLPDQKRIIYQMSRCDGLRTNEIAEKLNLTPGHVRNALSSSLQFIREYLVAAGKVIAISSIFLK